MKPPSRFVSSLLGVLALSSSSQGMTAPPSFVPPLDPRWASSGPRGELGAEFFASERFQRATLIASLGAAPRHDTWTWIDHVAPEPGKKGARHGIRSLSLEVTWDDQQRPKSARISELSMPVELGRAPTQSELERLAREGGWLLRPASLWLDPILPGTERAAVMNALGVPSEVWVNQYRWFATGPESSLVVELELADEAPHRVLNARWRWSYAQAPGPAQTIDQVPRDRFALLTREPGSAASYAIEEIWPASALLGESVAKVERRIGVMAPEMGLTIGSVDGRVTELTASSWGAAKLLDLQLRPNLLQGFIPHARFGLPTAQLPRAWIWRYLNPRGVLEVTFELHHRMKWSWAPTRSCELGLPSEDRVRGRALQPTGGDTRAARLLEGLPKHRVVQGWMDCLEARIGLAVDQESRRKGGRTRAVAAATLRSQLAHVPAFAALGEPKADWIERFGSPSLDTGEALTWLFFEGEDHDRELEITAHDVVGEGRFDELEIRFFEAPRHPWVSGLSLRRLDMVAAVLGPSDPAVKADGPRTWRGGAVRFDPDTGVLTLDHKVGGAALSEWLEQRGVSGWVVEVLGASLVDAYSALPGGTRTAWQRDGIGLAAYESRREHEVAFLCSGPSMRCERIELGPSHRVWSDD